MISKQEALQRLTAGNQRFQANALEHVSRINDAAREDASHGQQPWAVVLSCSDSRVPVAHIFDQALGDLFVVRIAGNIATEEVIGSIEFSVASYDTPLVVVLGHSGCGAVKATINSLVDGEAPPTPNLAKIVAAIEPAVQTAQQSGEGDLFTESIKANTALSASALTARSELLAQRVQDGQLTIVQANYDLATGQVSFLS